MFTGIVEELGKIQNITSEKIIIECKTVLEDTKLGDSIAVNGVCLTVIDLTSASFTADISPETLKVMVPLKIGSFVNLERAMGANGRFGGHIVTGHVDGKGKFLSANQNCELKFELTPELSRYVIKKGSIAINGISLTIAKTGINEITMAIIPHTLENTNLKYLKSGDFVNIEVDMMAKYVEKFLSTVDNKSNITMDFLQENGFG